MLLVTTTLLVPESLHLYKDDRAVSCLHKVHTTHDSPIWRTIAAQHAVTPQR